MILVTKPLHLQKIAKITFMNIVVNWKNKNRNVVLDYNAKSKNGNENDGKQSFVGGLYLASPTVYWFSEEASLRERKHRVHRERMQRDREARGQRALVDKEEAIRNFQTLLVDRIHHHTVSMAPVSFLCFTDVCLDYLGRCATRFTSRQSI
jgi:hypothetical protein